MTSELPWVGPTTDPVMHLCRLFLGRSDGYAVDNPGAGMRRVDSDPAGIVSAVRAHVIGEASIGIYPLVEETVPWGCIDIDNHHAPLDTALVSNLQRLLTKLGLMVWHEISRSSGAHLWVFATEPVPASTMRNALLAAAQILGTELDEVNPKQTSGIWGNLVRLPYHGGLDVTLRRQVVTDPVSGQPMDLRDWVRATLMQRNTPTALARVAGMYKPPAPPKALVSSEPVSDAPSYVAAALQGEFDDVAHMPPGNRNHRLYQSAMKLGRFLPTGQASAEQIEKVLFDAATTNGLVSEDGAHVVIGTIRSGIKNGASRG